MSLAASLPRGATSQYSTAFAEPLLWAKLWVRPGQAGTQHPGPGEMLTSPCPVMCVDICSLEGRHPGISFLQCLQLLVLKTPCPQAIYLFIQQIFVRQMCQALLGARG